MGRPIESFSGTDDAIAYYWASGISIGKTRQMLKRNFGEDVSFETVRRKFTALSEKAI